MSFTSRRDLALVVTSRAVSLLGDEVAAVSLLLRLQGNGAGAWAVAALLTAALAPIVVLAPWVGRLVDRRDNRALLIASSAGQALLCTALAFAGNTAMVLALVMLLGAGQAVNGACWQALLPAIAGTERLPRALGISQAATTATAIAAPALGGWLTGWYGVRTPLLIDAGTFVVVTAAALVVRTRRVVAHDDGERPRGGFAIVAADPLLRSVLLLLAVFITLGASVNVVDVFLVRETLHASATWYGVVGGVYGIGMAAGAVYAGRRRGAATMARALVWSSAVLAVGLAGYAAVPSVLWLLVPAIAVGVANGVLNVAAGSLLMQRAAAAEHGRVAAVIGAVASGAQIGAYALAGVVSSFATPREVFIGGGLLGLLAPVALGRRVVQTADHDGDRTRTTDPVGHPGNRGDCAPVHA